jgi:hypothetical protein
VNAFHVFLTNTQNKHRNKLTKTAQRPGCSRNRPVAHHSPFLSNQAPVPSSPDPLSPLKNHPCLAPGPRRRRSSPLCNPHDPGVQLRPPLVGAADKIQSDPGVQPVQLWPPVGKILSESPSEKLDFFLATTIYCSDVFYSSHHACLVCRL